MDRNCLFCRIIQGVVPSSKVFEDDYFFAFHDIKPSAPIHLLLVPKQHIVSLQEITGQDTGWLGKMMVLVPKLARDNGCRAGILGGFRLVVNSGADGGQEVEHLHLHILGGDRLAPKNFP